LADAATPQACLAVFPKPDPTKAAEIRQRRLDAVTSGWTSTRLFGAVLASVRSANVGAIARLSCASLMTPGSANPWLPKAIRAGAGAPFRPANRVETAQKFSDASQLLSAFSRILDPRTLAVADREPCLSSAAIRSDSDAGSSICLLLWLRSQRARLPDELMKSLNEAATRNGFTMLHDCHVLYVQADCLA
uniref:Photolyase/cryptochrome alpha/beta domain-containing protein n=1 Tax=Macrostomum lignano TaxID=282301 RepID=A0A1I8FJW5_9PLAT